MVFSSLIFVLVFLAIHLAVYALVDERHRNVVLLVSSLIFYAWGGPRYLLLLAGETAVVWALALVGAGADRRVRRLCVALGCAILLGLLAYFKYTGFLLSNMRAIFGVPEEIPQVVLPIGVSFYTFQLISYLVDACSGRVEPQRAYWKLLLYSSLFHQCIAGPIVRYETVAAEIEHRSPSPSDIYYGVRRFCVGLAKKAVLANSCAAAADSLLPMGSEGLATQAVSGLWLGMVFYALQIYLDFSAYSDMAIALGRMIGFHYLENFDHPYEAASVQEFWRKWHISLSTFFRDYVYIPLGGSRVESRLYVRNMCVVWLLTGLWHGASWNYVLWGVYYLGLLLLERFVIRGRVPRAAGHALTLLAVVVGWALFKFEDFGELGSVISGMLLVGGRQLTTLSVHTTLMQNVFLLVAGAVACTSLGSRLRAALHRASRTNDGAFALYRIEEAATPVILLAISIVAMAGASYNPFIYFQF